MNRRIAGLVAMVAVASSAITLVGDHLLLHPVRVVAQESEPRLENFIFFAQHRKDTAKDESFFFYNPKTGDIYVYQEAKAKEHYRVRRVGEDLEKLR